MSEENKIQEAIDLWQAGKRSKARDILLELEPKVKSPKARLHLINAALAILSPTQDSDKIIALAREGVATAKANNLHEYHAHFMARLADALTLPVSMRNHRRAFLKLAPQWIGFSTETDRDEYDLLTQEVEALIKEADNLLTAAITLAEHIESKHVQADVLLSKGSVESSRYIQAVSDTFRGKWRAKIWLRLPFTRHPALEYLLMLGGKDGKRLRGHIQSFTDSFSRAATLYQELGDDSTAANAYYNLANDLRTAHRFGRANRYLTRARQLAEKANDEFMLRKIRLMKESIKQKNRDVPDYLNGETRSLDEV